MESLKELKTLELDNFNPDSEYPILHAAEQFKIPSFSYGTFQFLQTHLDWLS